MITYRLADALPRHVAVELAESDLSTATARKRSEAVLDAGYGSCILRRPEVAAVVVENWYRFDGERYRLLSWVIMPNHVHLIVDVIKGHPLSRIVHGWKSYTAKRIQRLTGQVGKVWQEDYWDRAIRDERHFAAAAAYIAGNPAAAGLVDWRWSSENENYRCNTSSSTPKAMR